MMNKSIIILLTVLTLVSCKDKKTPTTTDEAVIEVKSNVTDKIKESRKKSPKFTNLENFDGSKTSLDDLKGKYVYVDVWATWCPPCRKEIPFLQKIEKQYRDKNIVFVSLSVDKVTDKEKWKKMITAKKMSGIQLFSGSNQAFVNAYKVNSIPRFILIDDNGNIANDNATRPSDATGIAQLFSEI